MTYCWSSRSRPIRTKMDAEILCGICLPRSASASSSSNSRSRTSESFDAGEMIVSHGDQTCSENIPRSFETYGLGREVFACHSSTIFLHRWTVPEGNVAVKSLATLRWIDFISTAFTRFVSSNEPTSSQDDVESGCGNRDRTHPIPGPSSNSNRPSCHLTRSAVRQAPSLVSIGRQD